MAAISTTAYFSSQPQLPATAAAKSGGRPARRRQQRRRSSSFVMLEAAAAAATSGSGGAVGRTRSLTEEDLEELKGCLDLGFGFAYHEIPELCGTLPALELCYSMTRRFLDEQRAPGQEPPATPPLPNWRISGPGDDPEEVKARLKYWAQAVACTVSKYTDEVLMPRVIEATRSISSFAKLQRGGDWSHHGTARKLEVIRGPSFSEGIRSLSFLMEVSAWCRVCNCETC
uniref:Uncharacterized protein n=1 Tax=Oryza punctata TaxID=4537 RepID=A0A0E0JS83_ORYPU